MNNNQGNLFEYTLGYHTEFELEIYIESSKIFRHYYVFFVEVCKQCKQSYRNVIIISLMHTPNELHESLWHDALYAMKLGGLIYLNAIQKATGYIVYDYYDVFSPEENHTKISPQEWIEGGPEWR
jgi:hypothetical protein